MIKLFNSIILVIELLNLFNNWMVKWDKKSCPYCSSSKVQRNGMSRQRRQRWLCCVCGHTFIWKNRLNKSLRQRIWFIRWIVEGYAIRQLSIQSGHSFSTIRRVIEYWLLHPPCNTKVLSEPRYLIFDGTNLEQHRGIFTVMNANGFSVLHGVPDISEGPSDLLPFCLSLAQRRLYPKSATVDGNPHLIKILRSLWPDIIIQRCLVHIQRQGLSWCRINPKRTDAKQLRELFLQVMSIDTLAERDLFLAQVNEWEQKYGHQIASSAETGWVFSDLKRARSMLLSALPDMFHYLYDPNIPKSTNALEGYYARLKQKYYQHRGLVKQHRDAYFTWYLNLCPR